MRARVHGIAKELGFLAQLQARREEGVHPFGRVGHLVDVIEVLGTGTRGVARRQRTVGVGGARHAVFDDVSGEGRHAGVAKRRAHEGFVIGRVRVLDLREHQPATVIDLYIAHQVVAIFIEIAGATDQARGALGHAAGGVAVLEGGADTAALQIAVGNDVDHASHRVRAVNGRCAVFEHLNALNGVYRNGVDVGKSRLATVGQAEVGNASAVKQHQSGAFAQATKAHTRRASRKAGRGAVVLEHVIAGGDGV